MILPIFVVMELKKYFEGWKSFADGLEAALVEQIHEEKALFEEFVTEQLYSGVNGDEIPLRPKYSEDPYFHSFKSPKKEVERYRKWKMRIQPPARSYLGFRPRNSDTPNLIIRGDFYASITAIPIADGLSIVSRGLMFSADIEKKYGDVIYEIGDKAKLHYVRYYMLPKINQLMKSHGL